jgi:PAS domain S-box-containing protein
LNRFPSRTALFSYPFYYFIDPFQFTFYPFHFLLIWSILLIHISKSPDQHYLKDEFYDLIKNDDNIFDFIRAFSLDGLWYWDLEDPEHKWMDAKFWTTLGYDPETMPHRADAWQDVIDQADLQVVLKNFQKHVADPSHPYDQVVRYRHKNGSTVWIRCRGIAIRDENGTPVRMLGAHIDVTEDREAESLTLEEALLYKTFHEKQPAYLIKLDPAGNYTYVNDFYCADFGWTREALIGQSSLIGVVEDDHQKAYEVRLACYAEPGKLFQVRLRKTFKDGSIVKDTDWEFTVLTNAQGEPGEVICIGVDVTKQVEAEAALQTSEAQFRFIAEHTSDGIVVFSYGKVMYVSPSYTRIMAYSLKDLQDHTLEDTFALIHPEDRQRINTLIHNALIERAYELTYQYRALHKDGHYVWLENATTFLYNADGSPSDEGLPLRSVITIKDITERQQAEIALHDSENRYRLLAENSKDLISLRRLDNTLIYASPAYEQVLGYSREELSVLPSKKLLHPDDVDQFRAVYHGLLSGSSEQVLHYRLRKKDGAYVWMEVYVGLVTDDVSGEQRILATSRDITERKHAEDALRESKKQLDLFFNQSLTGFFFFMLDEPIMWDGAENKEALLEYTLDHQRVTKANQAFADQYGGNVLGYTVRDFFVNDPDTGKALWRNLFDVGHWHVEVENGERRPDGSPLAIEGDYICLYDDQGRITGHFGVQQDVTSRKQAEQAVQATLKQLEQALDHNNLLMKELHHRVKNNMAVIASLLALQSHGLKDEKAKEALRDSRTRVVAMSEIHELMYRHDNVKTIAFDEYLTSLVSRMERSFSRGKQRIRFSLNTGSFELGFDQAIPLGLIINELLTNTTKYAFPEAHADPQVTITITVDDGLTVVVADNGVGLADEEILATSDSLGMTVIHSLTDQLGGSIYFDNRSNQDTGLRAVLHIPLTPEPVSPKAS